MAAGQARNHHRHPQAARLQRRRDHRQDQGAATATDRRVAAGGEPRSRGRSHANHPGRGQRRAAHHVDHDPTRGAGDLFLRAQPLGDAHPERGDTSVAGRRPGRHVRAGLQPRQHLPDGHDHRRRLRRRRRNRRGRERHAPPRAREKPPAGGHRRLPGSELHHHLHDRVAHRRFHPRADDGRHRRPPVPGVRRDGHGRDPDVRHRFADRDADDVRLAHPARAHREPRQAVSLVGADLRRGLRVSTSARWTACSQTP